VQFWLAEAQYAFAFFGILAVLLFAPWIHAQYRRFGGMRGWPAVVSAATVLYGCALVAFTLFPLPDFSGSYCSRRTDLTYWQTSPFASLDDVALYAQDHSFLQTLLSDPVLQVVMNVVFFVPLGLLVAYRWRRSLWVALLASFGVSLTIELTQGTGLWGLAPCPYRLADVDDLLTNTLGGAVGWFIGLACRRLLPDPAPAPLPDLAPPSLRRRLLSAVIDAFAYVVLLLGILVVDERLAEAPDRGTTPFIVTSIAVSLLLFVVVPAIRRNRSTPGAATVLLVPVRLDGRRAPLAALLACWALRWLPIALVGLAALPVVLAVDGLVAWRRADDRSLVEVIARIRVVTEQQREVALGP
jgi:glycopeptide antibiotics resistance protein